VVRIIKEDQQTKRVNNKHQQISQHKSHSINKANNKASPIRQTIDSEPGERKQAGIVSLSVSK